MLRSACCLLVILFCKTLQAQTDSNLVLRFDFNDQEIREAHNLVKIRSTGVILTEDRFGNSRSAVYFHGDAESYITLGTSPRVKPQKGSLAFWVNVQSKVYFGKGYPSNPFLLTKNAPGEDFILAYSLNYNFHDDRFNATVTKDSMEYAMLYGRDTVALNTWYHLVLTFDNSSVAFYINGELQTKMKKSFKTTYYAADSVMLGRTTGSKNMRYAHAIIDDIVFFHRVLSDKEILALYHEPNPNRVRNFLSELLKYGLIIIGLVVVIIILIIRNRRNLKRQKEYYELHNRINELEIKAIKSQMNPHFISNSMAAIQSLIFGKEYDKASEYIAKLGLLMRQILECSEKTYISLHEELIIIQLNLELEQLRFENNFSYSIVVEPDINTKEAVIPSLITQPFIENAIWHGLLPLTQRTPQLTIHVYKQNNAAFIVIEDNGVGRHYKQNINNSSFGIKLATDKIEGVNRLRNNNDFKLTIIDLTNEQGQAAGTRIIIQLLTTFDE